MVVKRPKGMDTQWRVVSLYRRFTDTVREV